MNFTTKQTDAWYALANANNSEVLFGGGAGGGKSAFGCMWLIAMCYKYPKTRWLMGRAKLKTLKETTLNSFYEVCQRHDIISGRDYKFNSQSGVITWKNGSEIIIKDLFLYPSDPNFDELGSLEITGAFIDECNQIVEKAWLIVKSRIRYKLDENNISPKMLGTCNPSKNWVYSRFYNPSRKGTLGKGLVFIVSLLTDNPFISSHYQQNLESLDEASKQRLLYGNFDYDDDPSILITFDAIQDSFTNEFIITGKKYITADIARFGSDKTVIMVWNGYKVIDIKELLKSSVTQSAELIKSLALQYSVPNSNIIVDEDGVGGGVKDILDCKGFVNNSIPIEVQGKKENYRNLKSQCYFKLAERMNKNQYCLMSKNPQMKEDIIKELSWVKRYNFDKDGKLEVLPKDKIKEAIGRSPDYSDTLMMREWFDLVPLIDWKFL